MPLWVKYVLPYDKNFFYVIVFQHLVKQVQSLITTEVSNLWFYKFIPRLPRALLNH